MGEGWGEGYHDYRFFFSPFLVPGARADAITHAAQRALEKKEQE
jgi:hypothetical protein